MITLKSHKDNVELCKLKHGKKLIPVYWHPVRNKDLRLSVTNLEQSWNNEDTRDRFRISKQQMSELLKHLKEHTVR